MARMTVTLESRLKAQIAELERDNAHWRQQADVGASRLAEAEVRLAEAQTARQHVEAALRAAELTGASLRGRIADLAGNLAQSQTRLFRLQDAFRGLALRLGEVETQRVDRADHDAYAVGRRTPDTAGPFGGER